MEHGSGARNSGPVALPPPPTTAFMTKPVHRDILENAGAMSCAQSAAASSAVHLVCTNPSCTVATWMDVGDWEARMASAQRQSQQQRGWNGDEDDWRPDHVGSAGFPEQLACPCGRGFRRRATMPSTSSAAAVAARLDRLHQLRQMRRSEPMLAAGAAGLSHLPADWSGPYQWPSDSHDGFWSSRPAIVQQPPHFGFCPQSVAAERFRPELPVSSTRQRVCSEPETYDSANQCATGETNGYVYPGNTQLSQLRKVVNGYTLQPSQLASSTATLDFCSGDLQLGGSMSLNFKPNSVDMIGAQTGQNYAGHQESERHRNGSGLTPKRPSRPDAMSRPGPSSVNGNVASRRPANSTTGGSRRDGASPDSMSSDGGSSAASTGSATGRRKPSITGATAGGRRSNACSRGNIFRQRTPTELATFRSLSIHCNAYEVQTSGDDAPYGKDRLRTHVLVALSAARRSTVDCVICSSQMVVYHDFPLLDGLFFESPMRYNSDVRVEPLTIGGLHRQPLSDASKFYLNAVCFRCLQGDGNTLECRSCGSPWNGSLFVVGNVYLYDVFAAMLCCDARLECRRCGKLACEGEGRPAYYSDGSRQVRCARCRAVDHHYVKPLDALFTRVAKATDHTRAG